jgi:hypothetical protein
VYCTVNLWGQNDGDAGFCRAAQAQLQSQDEMRRCGQRRSNASGGIAMTRIGRSLRLGLAGAVIGLAGVSQASAYTYTFRNSTKETLSQVWMHTVSVFCHDVNWNGGVGPGRSVRISSASICLVDRVEVNGGALKFSSPIGLSGGTFTVGGNGRLCYNGLC